MQTFSFHAKLHMMSFVQFYIYQRDKKYTIQCHVHNFSFFSTHSIHPSKYSKHNEVSERNLMNKQFKKNKQKNKSQISWLQFKNEIYSQSEREFPRSCILCHFQIGPICASAFRIHVGKAGRSRQQSHASVPHLLKRSHEVVRKTERGKQGGCLSKYMS